MKCVLTQRRHILLAGDARDKARPSAARKKASCLVLKRLPDSLFLYWRGRFKLRLKRIVYHEGREET